MVSTEWGIRVQGTYHMTADIAAAAQCINLQDSHTRYRRIQSTYNGKVSVTEWRLSLVDYYFVALWIKGPWAEII